MGKYTADIINKHLYKRTLVHLSFKAGLAGVWSPRTPDGHDGVGGLFTETNIPRISCSPTILQSLQAIYPNISTLYEEKNYPYLDFYVYRPVLDGSSRLILPEELTNGRHVWDAHITKEHGILTKTTMVLGGKVRIYNPKDQKGIRTHPFNDKAIPLRYVGPAAIKCKLEAIYCDGLFPPKLVE